MTDIHFFTQREGGEIILGVKNIRGGTFYWSGKVPGISPFCYSYTCMARAMCLYVCM